MFPGKGNKLMEKWNDMRPIIMSKLQINPVTMEYQKKFAESLDENQKDLITFYALPHLVFSKQKIENKTTPGHSWSLSIPDTKAAFILSVPQNAMNEKLLERQQRRQPFGLDPQPLIVVFENDVLDAKEYIIKFDNILYSFKSIKTCIDVIFKLFFIFNIQYPEEAKNTYIFLQRFIYEIKLTNDDVPGKVTSFMSKLKTPK